MEDMNVISLLSYFHDVDHICNHDGVKSGK